MCWLSVSTTVGVLLTKRWTLFYKTKDRALLDRRFQWPHCLRRWSAAAHLLGFRVRIPDVCFECCVLSGRGLCFGLITRPEESYRLWCV
jgi:hypothetical protein